MTNFARSKIEWPKVSLKGELQDVIRNLMDQTNKSLLIEVSASDVTSNHQSHFVKPLSKSFIVFIETFRSKYACIYLDAPC